MSPQRQCSVSRATPVTGLRFIKRSAIITGGLAGATADIRFVPDLDSGSISQLLDFIIVQAEVMANLMYHGKSNLFA